MQHSPTEIKEKLLKALDREYNVVDMAAVVEVISILERTPITKDALETTRLGKFINELRRKTKNESLAKRAKDLVRRWRDMILPTGEPSPAAQPVVPVGQQYNGASSANAIPVATTANRNFAGAGRLSPGLPLHGNISPGLPPHSRHLNRSATVSPAMSLPSSDRSNTSPRPTSRSTTPRPMDSIPVIPKPTVVSVSSGLDPVPKTHASNKRLRKSDSPVDDQPAKKVKRPNGLSSDTTGHGISNSLGRSDLILSGECSRDSFSVVSDHGSNSCEVIKTVPASEPLPEAPSGPKKRGRKKGSKNKAKTQDPVSELSRDDLVKAKIASIGRTHRVKTTQELLADLQARNSGLPTDNVNSSVENKASLANCLLSGTRGGARDALEISRNKTEHIAKFLRSQPDLELSNQEFPSSRDVSDDLKDNPIPCREDADHSDAASLPSRLSKDIRSPTGSNSRDDLIEERPLSALEAQAILRRESPEHQPVGGDRSVEEILARLPPIDVDAINWEDSVSQPSTPQSQHICEDDVIRLHTEHIEGVNGVVNHGSQGGKDDSGTDFREWHETVSRTSYQGELLHILPYVVID